MSIPEICEGDLGRGWKLRDSRGKLPTVDFHNKIVYAPAHPSDRNERLRQSARARFDDGGPAVTTIVEYLVENYRLGHLLGQRGANITGGFKPLHASLVPSDHDAFPVFRALHDGGRLAVADEIRERIRKDPSRDGVRAVSRWLEVKYEFTDEIPEGVASGGDLFDDTLDELPEDTLFDALDARMKDALPSRKAESIGRENRLIKPGEMTIEEPPLRRSAVGRMQKKWRSIDEGVYPRYPHRLLVDGRVFARRCRVPGGAVLIDHSGSMSLAPEQVSRMVELAPGCVVASYSGSGDKGVLRVLAKNGGRAEDDQCRPPFGGGNIVDYPALRWLYAQRHPRIWVSDFGVTGVDDRSSPGMYKMCEAVVQKGHIQVMKTAESAIKFLEKFRHFYRVP